MTDDLDCEDDEMLCTAEVSKSCYKKSLLPKQISACLNICQAASDDEIEILCPDGQTLTFKHTGADCSDMGDTITINQNVLVFLLERCVLFGQSGK